jgi:hypothetical protein
MAELMLGQPLFPGESGIDQLVEIIKVLGTPSREQIKTMNPNVSSLVYEFWRSCAKVTHLDHLFLARSTWNTNSPKSSLTPSARSSDRELLSMLSPSSPLF